MAASSYPLDAGLRQSANLTGDGVTTVFGPFSFKVFDVADVEIWRKQTGERRFTKVTSGVTIAKTSLNDFETVTATFDVAPAATTTFYAVGSRTPSRSLAPRKAQVVDTNELDRELTKIALVQQEEKRQSARTLTSDRNITTPQVVEEPEEDATLTYGADGTIVNGPAVAVLEDWKSTAAAARDQAVTAKDLAASSATAAQTSNAQAGAASVASQASATSASASASDAGASALAAAAARAAAASAAEAVGNVRFFDTKAAADAGIGGVSDGWIVEIFADETRDDARTRYLKSGGGYVYKLTMPDTTTDLANAAAAAMATPGLIGRSVGNLPVYVPKSAVDLREFGSIEIADHSALFNAAFAQGSAEGFGTIYVPQGTYYGRAILPKSNVHMIGYGAWIKPEDDDDEHNAVFRSLTDPLENLHLEGIGFAGNWGAFLGEVSDNGLLTIKFCTKLTIDKCKFKNSRFMSININQCDDVLVTGNRLRYSCRDFIGVWGTPNVIVAHNVMDGNDDDGISINYETGGLPDPVRSGAIVAYNILRDSGGIRVQVPKNVIIQGNQGDRQHGFGIALWVRNTSTNDMSAALNVKVRDNIITNVMDRQWKVSGTQTGSTDSRIGILVESVPGQAGSYDVVPGQIDPSVGYAPNPYDAFFEHGSVAEGVGPIRFSQGFEVCDNTIMRTLPGVSRYSDWGYGPAFTAAGLQGAVDQVSPWNIPGSLLSGKGIRISLPQEDLEVCRNEIAGHKYGISIKLTTGQAAADHLLKRARLNENRIRDFEGYGIGSEITDITQQDIEISRNLLDGDPYHTNPNRGPNGTWAADGNCIAISVPFLRGAVIEDNRIRNVCRPIRQDSASAYQSLARNLLFGQPVTSGFSTGNMGIGVMPAIADGGQWWLHGRNSDPEHAAYGDTFGDNLRNDSNVCPQQGWWLAGTVVRARGLTLTGDSALYGWYRVTTSASNILGTDWTPLYISITAGYRQFAPITPPAAPATGAVMYCDSGDAQMKIKKAGGGIIVLG